MTIVNVFSSVNKIVLTPLNEYFIAAFLNSCFAWQFAPLSPGAQQFLSTNSSQGIVVTHLRYGGIFYYSFTTNLLLSQSVEEC